MTRAFTRHVGKFFRQVTRSVGESVEDRGADLLAFAGASITDPFLSKNRNTVGQDMQKVPLFPPLSSHSQARENRFIKTSPTSKSLHCTECEKTVSHAGHTLEIPISPSSVQHLHRYVLCVCFSGTSPSSWHVSGSGKVLLQHLARINQVRRNLRLALRTGATHTCSCARPHKRVPSPLPAEELPGGLSLHAGLLGEERYVYLHVHEGGHKVLERTERTDCETLTQKLMHTSLASLGRNFLLVDPGMAPRTCPVLLNMDETSK